MKKRQVRKSVRSFSGSAKTAVFALLLIAAAVIVYGFVNAAIVRHNPADIQPQGATSGLDADTTDALHASSLMAGGGGGAYLTFNWIKEYKHYFFTDATYDANLGGTAGCNAKCNADINIIAGKSYHCAIYTGDTTWNAPGIGLYNSKYGESPDSITIYAVTAYAQPGYTVSIDHEGDLCIFACGDTKTIGSYKVCGCLGAGQYTSGAYAGAIRSFSTVKFTSSNTPGTYLSNMPVVWPFYPSPGYCSGWTSNSGTITTESWGFSGQTIGFWPLWGGSSESCGVKHNLLCVED